MTSIALTTGANRGLGFEIARQLGQSGAKTLVAGRDAEKGQHAAAELAAESLDVDTVVLDVVCVSSVEAAAEHIAKEYGRLDILVSNAGILPEATASEISKPLDLSLFRRTFETNLFGASS